MSENVDDFLQHFGIKGMKWGVRRNTDGGTSAGGASGGTKKPMSSEEKKARAKKIAMGAGVLALAAGTAYAGYRLQKSGHLKIPSLGKNKVDEGKKFTVKTLSEPAGLVHATRFKDAGHKFLGNGGLIEPLREYDKAGFGLNQDGPLFNRYEGKIAARFVDPEGRKDAATRPIMHEVIVPKHMTKDINSLDDVKAKIWPKIKDSYAASYHAPQRPDVSDIIRDKPVNIRAAKAYKDAGLGTESEYFSMLKRVQNSQK